MQKDSVQVSASGHVTYNQAVTQESPTKYFLCRHCKLLCKSKVYLFEHLSEKHGFDVDAALREAGFKTPGTGSKTSTDSSGNTSGNNFECQLCDFKACSWDVLNEHEKQCQINVIGNQIVSENLRTKVHLTNQHKEAAGAAEVSSVSPMPTSQTKCTYISTKDLKTYKRPLQTITKYFRASSGSNGKPPVKLDDSPVILQESPADSSPNSSGVFKVTAKPTIDISKTANHYYLLNDHLVITDLRPEKPKEQFRETVSNNVGKRTNSESLKSAPAKRAKSDKEEPELQGKAKASTQQSPGNRELFEFSEDEEEKKVNLVNGDTDNLEVHFCRHCDYSDVSMRRVSTHYQEDHPYIRYNINYIQDPSDESATFRCLECPVDFLSLADLKRHYAENHPDAPDVFSRQLRELVFKCFVCQFTTSALKSLKEHYKEKHSTHEVDNPLMYCRYSATTCQEGPSQWNICKKALSPERPRGISHDSAHTPRKEVKNAPPPQHASPKGADVTLYRCSNCTFSHKSVVVMHVHYQKTHPQEAVTIDKIKQSACPTSHTALQMTPDKSPSSAPIKEKMTPQKSIPDSSKETRNKAEISPQKEISLSLKNPKHTPKASKTDSMSAKTKEVEPAEDRGAGRKLPIKRKREMSIRRDSLSCSSPNELFYCQFCSYTSANVKSVVGHHNAKHALDAPIDVVQILQYSAEIQKKELQRGAEASARTTSSVSKSCKQVEVCSENEVQCEGDEGADASVMRYNAYARAENLFYCQMCNYGNTSAQGVLNHQAKAHHSIKSNLESILEYTALIRDKIEKSKSQAKELPFSTNLPFPLLNEGDEDVFFCHFCNYRHSNVTLVLRHCLKQHRGFVVTREQIRRYTSVVLTQAKKSHLKTTASQEVKQTSLEKKKKIKFGKVSASPSIRASQTERTLQCYRCTYSTQYVYLLRRHMWKIHRSNRSVADLLRVYFKLGKLQTGHHCDMCVFSHIKAETVHKHYQEQHPARRLSLEYVSTRLYVGPETVSSKKKKPQIKHTDGISDDECTDGSSPSQRPGQNETKTYSCRACSFKGISMSSITHHYRAVHPWSVKEDGSVMYLINSKKPNGSKRVEDQNETPVSFDSYQAPLEFEKAPGSSHQAVSSKNIQCPFCPARFPSQRGLNTHCGMKHQEAILGNSIKQQEEQVQIQTRVHVFKCPHCTYVNTNYQGVLTHCQMRHPSLASRADSLYVDEAHLHNWEHCMKRKGPGLRLCGYMCKTCLQMYATLEKLNKHCEEGHNDTVVSTVPNKPTSAPKPSAVSKRKQHKTHSNQGSVSKASFLSKKTFAVVRCHYCSYSCTTKLAVARHMQVRHKMASISKTQDCLYKCALCSSFYFKKKRLGSHYAKKHGKEAFLKYYVPLYKQDREKPPPNVLECSSPLQPENTSEGCESSTTVEENKKLVFKCPSCPYVNASYHGTLTHCQMRHPDLVARADELQTDEILLVNMVSCTMGKGSNVRGYACKKCPQIHVSLKKLKIHCERDHDRAEATASAHSAETEKQPNHSSRGSVSEAVSPKNKTSAVSAADIGFGHQLSSPEICESKTQSVLDKKSVYKCRICAYRGSCRRYLYCHYKKTHKLDAFTTRKLLEKYNKRNRKKAVNLSEADSGESAHVKCKMCPELKFDSSQLLIDHYRSFHNSDSLLDFIVLSQASKRTTGLYKCALCKKQLNGIRKLCHHLDRHRETEKKAAKTSVNIATSPEAKSVELCGQDELPVLETVGELAQWYMTPVETFTAPSPLSSPSEATDGEQPELQSREAKLTCKQCARSFMSLKGLRSHERSHAAVAAIKKLNNLSTSAIKHNINKYVLYKAGTMRPFLCSFCSYRTTVMGLWRRHFMKKHQDVLMDPDETDIQDAESAQSDEGPTNSEELNNLPEVDEEAEITEKSLYLEPPDVQRQLDHYSLMARAGATSKAHVETTKLPENSLLHCEVCNFNTGHLSSMRRHYLNRHGKKILRCKDCSFFTGLRKTLEMHMEMGHSTCQSEPTHQKDLRCPFCLYQTKNKNNMIDHIVLHREERVVPIEVRRSKLSRYLQGIVFRCHKCTFTSGSAENLRLHMMKHDDIKPYKCRLCYFDCTRLRDLEAHLSDKHQVVRNHELVGQISLDQLEARVGRMPEEEEEPLSDMERDNNDSENIKTEEFVTDCDEVPHEKLTKNLAGNDRENTLQIKKAHQNQGQDGKNGDEEIPAKSSVLDLRCETAKSNTTVQEKQGPQNKEETAFLPDTERGQGIENIAEQKGGEGNNADIQYEDWHCPEKGRQTNVNQAQPKLTDSEANIVTFTQLKEAAEGRSTTNGKIAEEAQYHRHIKGLNHGTLNIEAKIEDDILRHVLQLDEDGGIKIPKTSGQDRTVKTEPNLEPEDGDNVLNEIPLLDEEGSRTLNHDRKNQVNTEPISTSAKTNHWQANNVRAQERFTVERHLLTLGPNLGQLKISHKGILGVSFTNCKEQHVQNQKNSDPYGDMPVLENECLKEEIPPLSCLKEEDQSDYVEQKQDEEDETIAEDDKNQCTNLEHQEGDGIEGAENPHEIKGGLAVTDGATTEEKLFTCELCGRNLENSSELERHIIRHGI